MRESVVTHSRWAAHAVLLLGLALQPASALAGVGMFHFQAPAVLAHAPTARMGPQSFIAAYAIQQDAGVQFELAGESLSFQIADLTYDRFRVGRDEQPVPGSEQSSVTPLNTGRSVVQINRLESNFTLILQPTAGFVAALGPTTIQSSIGRVTLSSGPYPSRVTLEPFPPAADHPNAYPVEAKGAFHHVRPESLGLTAEGEFFVLISGARVRVENATGWSLIDTGQRGERLGPAPPGSTGDVVRYHHVAMIGAIQGRITLNVRTEFLHILAERAHVSNVSVASLPLAEGALQFGSESQSYRNESHLDIQGNMTFELDRPTEIGPNIAARVSGDFVSVSENRLKSTQFDPHPTVGTAAAGLSVLLVVYLIASWLRRGTVYLFGQWTLLKWITWTPFAARLSHDQVLDHPHRRQLLNLLQNRFPYARLSTLRREASHVLGIPAFTVYYHLRKLHAAHLIDVVQRGRNGAIYVAPNHQLVGSLAAKVTLALLQTRVGRAVADALVARQGATQKELIETIQASLRSGDRPGGRISRVAVHKWIRKFESFEADNRPRTWAKPNPSGDLPTNPSKPVRLVERKREGRRVRYWPTAALREAVERFRLRSAQAETATT